MIQPATTPSLVQIVTLTINGRHVEARTDQTVLRAARQAGIDIPTLCDHPALVPHGGCRLCVVEIEKQRTLQPSCTFPVSDGLVVRTDTPRVLAARRFALEMLFSERNHYCMFCPVSGNASTSDCKLQRLAYQHGMTHWPYAPQTSQSWPIDATRKHLVMDHSRCILCRRCIRACNDLVANHTLGAHFRGARTMVGADHDVPLGQSTCVSCGTCWQVCPTGAIVDRHSAYLGHDAEIHRTRTICMACALGCPVDAVTRHNQLLRVEGVWDAPNRGVLCELGRFQVVSSRPARLRRPLVRRDGQMIECSWEQALGVACNGLKRAASVAGLITARSTDESLIAFARFFHDVLRSDRVSLISGQAPSLQIGAPAGLEDINQADCIVVIAGDPLRTHRVLGYLIRGAVDRGARLLVAAEQSTGLDDIAERVLRLVVEPDTPSDPHEALRLTAHVRLDRLAEIRQAIESAVHPVVVHGPQLGDALERSLRTLPASTRFLPLVDGPNAVGAARQGLRVRPVQAEALYAIVSDEPVDNLPVPQADFRIIQSSFHNPWTEQADVALPSKIWYEKQGHITGFAGRRLTLTRPVDAPEDLLNDWQTLFLISVMLGRPLNCVGVNLPAEARP